MKRFKNILCVVNTDHKHDSAMEHAVKLAEKNQACLTVVNIIDDVPPDTELHELFTEDLKERLITQHQKNLEKLVKSWNIKIEIKVLAGIEYLEIIYEILRNGHDLVIKMTENEGFIKSFFGSNDMHLLRKCPIPVWLIKPGAPKTYQRILAAVDANNYYPDEELETRKLLNFQILEMSSSLALSEPSELHIIHAWEALGEGLMRGGFAARPEREVNAYVKSVKQRHSENLKALISEVGEKLGQDTLDYLKPKIELIKGDPSNSISEFARKIDVDLVIMGTVARTGIPGFFMGNTAERILNLLDCSVLAIKPSGFKTPVMLDE
jgi:universal stress protein E